MVGAGFARFDPGRTLAAGSNKTVLLIDKRPHIGGNAYDHKDAAGVLMHKYGPHIFHTNSTEIVSYLSRFTRWAALRAPGAGLARRGACADADQPHHGQHPVRAQSADRRGGRGLLRQPRRAGGNRQDIRGRGRLQDRPRAL
ncbi:MAG: NAD(P)-binding protein [Caulobacteraceae bacterium]